MKRAIFSMALIITLTIPVSAAADGLRAVQDGTRLEVRTPEHEKNYFGGRDFQDLSDYKVVVPAHQPPAHQSSPRISAIQKSTPTTATPTTIQESEPIAQSAAEQPDELLEKANELYYQNQYAESLMLVEQVLRKSPNHTRAWLMKGSLYLVLGQREQATTAWQKAKELEKSK